MHASTMDTCRLPVAQPCKKLRHHILFATRCACAADSCRAPRTLDTESLWHNILLAARYACTADTCRAPMAQTLEVCGQWYHILPATRDACTADTCRGLRDTKGRCVNMYTTCREVRLHSRRVQSSQGTDTKHLRHDILLGLRYVCATVRCRLPMTQPRKVCGAMT